MKILTSLFTLVILFNAINTVDVYGTIYNNSGMNLTLITSILDHGDLNLMPNIHLGVDEKTYFQLDSNVINNRIEYTWGYIADDWCNNLPNTQVQGHYQYFYGANSCATKNAFCNDNINGTSSTMIVYYQNCPDIVVGSINPNYYITKNSGGL